MAELALNKLAERIKREIEESKEYREEFLNKQAHRYILTGDILYETVSEQLKSAKKYRKRGISASDFDFKLKQLCDIAAPLIISSVQNYKGRKATVVPKYSDTEVILVQNSGSDLSEDIFKLITNIKRSKVHKKLRDPIIEDLFGNFTESTAYKNYMSQSDEEYDRQLQRPTQRGAARFNALNRVLLGSKQSITNKETGEKSYLRRNGQIVVQGGFVDFGHIKEDAVANQRKVKALNNIAEDTGFLESIFGGLGGDITVKVTKELLNRAALLSAKFTQVPSEIKTRFKVDILISGTEEGSIQNRLIGTTKEKTSLNRLSSSITKKLEKEAWATQEGSDNPLSTLKKIVTNAAIDTLSSKNRAKLRRGKKEKLDVNTTIVQALSKQKKQRRSVRRPKILPINASSFEEKNRQTTGQVPSVQQNWNSLLPLINSRLTPRVIANMRFPSLVNRTGTFANSAKVVNIEQTREGFPTFVYDYERDPYDVFDRTAGRSPWNTPERDPRTLVDKSVREIVREMAIGRFYTRRA
jgi:hypothetical protein